MSDKKTDEKSGSTRRSFVQTSTAAITGAGLAGTPIARGAAETLALNGGPKAVTVPAAKQAEITKWPRYGDDEKRAVLELLESTKWYPEIPAFEKELKEYLKVPYVKAHSSGTCSLMSMFFALNLPPGSEIMVPSYTAWATSAPLHLFKYVPVFIDLNPRSMTFDVEYAKRHLTKQTRAVLPMHSFGNVCDMDQICDFAKENDLVVLEDAAQAQGATLKGKPVGTWGAMGAFSHQSTKILPAIEGGSGTYQTREYYERATVFGGYELAGGFPADSPYRKYMGTGIGPKFRIHSLGAAIARRQLRTMEGRITLEDKQVRTLTDRLVELPGISRPYVRPDARRVYWGSHLLFIDEAKAGCSKAAIIKALRAEGVGASEGRYDEQHKYVLYSEPQWWHHPVVIPQDLHGTTQVNRQAMRLPIFRIEAPELIEQYVKAFEKVWAHRSELKG